jgi:hypothetical protein
MHFGDSSARLMRYIFSGLLVKGSDGNGESERAHGIVKLVLMN